MSANLATVNGRTAFAMLAGSDQPWWAGLSGFDRQATEVPHGASVQEWREAGGLAWEALALPVQYMHEGVMLTDPNSRIVIRSDTGAPLATVSSKYKVHTIAEIFETFEKLCKTSFGGGWKLCTVGALNDGRIIWAQAERDEAAEVVPGDRVDNRLLLQTSFDGTQKSGACLTSVRVVCDNTRRQAWNGNKSKVTRSHRSNLDGSGLIRELGITEQSPFAHDIETCKRLADMQVSDGQARDILRALFDQKPISQARAEARAVQPDALPIMQGGALDLVYLLTKPARPESQIAPTIDVIEVDKDHRNIAKIMALYHGAGQGASLDGVKGTAWGLLNACTEFVDHHASRTDDTRRTSALFGQGAALKDRAFELIADRRSLTPTPIVRPCP